MQDRLPHNLEAERAFLGSMMISGRLGCWASLAAEDFFSEPHRQIYRTIVELIDLGESVDLITVATALGAKAVLEKVGGHSYLASLLDGVPIVATDDSLAKIIRKDALRRRLIQQAENLKRLASTEDFDRLAHEVDGLRRLLDNEKSSGPDSSLEVLEREYEEYVQRLDERSTRFGIAELDTRTGGFQLGEVVTVIARTAVGKSAIAQNVMQHVLNEHLDAGVVFFSLEMPRLQAFERQLQIFAGKQRHEVLSAYRAGSKSAIKADEFVSRFKDRLAVIDKPAITLLEIEHRVSALVALRRLKRVRLVVIDYLGYLGGGPRNASLVERISELARGVKQLAKNIDAVVLLLAQTSRSAGDGSEEVTLTDARDCGAIEDSADFLIGCWRPELCSGIRVEDFMEVQGELWFRILKARRGLQDKFWARFEGETLRVLSTEGGAVR